MPMSLPAALACSLALLAGAPAARTSPETKPFDAEAHAARVAELEPRTGLPVGWTVPDATLLKADGKETTLFKQIEEAKGPVVLVFYRGGWCPYCTRHLAAIGRKSEELKKLGATVIAVSPEGYDKLSVSQEKGKLTDIDYTLLSDADLDLATRFNLVFDVDAATQERYKGYGIDLESWNASEEWKLPVPAAFVIGKDKSIEWMYANEDYTTRVTADKLVEAVANAK